MGLAGIFGGGQVAGLMELPNLVALEISCSQRRANRRLIELLHINVVVYGA